MDLSALEIATAVKARTMSAEEVTRAALEMAHERDRALNCFTHLFDTTAIADARAIDARIAMGEDVGPLAGAPCAAKNLFDIAGVTTLAGAKLRDRGPPAREDAFVVAQAKRAGVVLIGATNMDEFAYGFATENAHYGATRNPHDTSRIAGGSSGGSASAVAGGLAPISLGSDTNGSVRVPAAFCGIWGLKPTFARLSRHGVFPFVQSLDHVGAFARSAADLAATYDAAQGDDANDPGQVRRAAERSLATLEDADRLRVATLDDFFRESASVEALAGLDTIAGALSAELRSLPYAREARAAAFCLTGAEGGALHLPTLRAQATNYDPAVRDRLIAGALLPAAIAIRAQRFRRFFRDQVRELFERFDVLLAPTTPFPAQKIGQATTLLGGKEVSVRASAGLFTQVFSFIGLPVVAAPITTGALPLGVQLIGPPWSEARLLRLARRLERDGLCAAKAPSSLLA